MPTDLIVDIVEQLERTAVREHMTIDEAIEYQFRLVDAAQPVLGSDEMFTEDYGQVRALATVGFGGGGRPRATARVEEVLASFFGTEDAVLVQGAGTGAIRSMLNAGLPAGASIVLHAAHPYKTTLPAMRHMGLDLHQVDFNDTSLLRDALRSVQPAGVYVQHVPQALGDVHAVDEVIALARAECGDELRVLVDDNYAAMRSRRLGVHMGADASALSFFKLLAPDQVGAVIGRGDIVGSIRRDLSSAGCQVQGPQAMAALRMLVYAPVALAIQNRTVLETAARIEALVGAGELRGVRRAIAAQPGIRCIVLVFDEPIAEEFLRSAWRNGSPSQSIGEEAQYEFLPLFTYLTSTFLKSTPGLEKHAVRINPMRSGPDTIVRTLRAALNDLRG
jgi:cystathionine beta-lyase family protein involved in aluminum resistance